MTDKKKESDGAMQEVLKRVLQLEARIGLLQAEIEKAKLLASLAGVPAPPPGLSGGMLGGPQFTMGLPACASTGKWVLTMTDGVLGWTQDNGIPRAPGESGSHILWATNYGMGTLYEWARCTGSDGGIGIGMIPVMEQGDDPYTGNFYFHPRFISETRCPSP